jgi:hypothetical protein
MNLEKRFAFGTEKKRKAGLKARRSGKEFMALTRRAFLGKLPAGVNEGVPGTAEAKMRFEPGALRPVRVVLNKEVMTVLTHPLDSGHIVIAEFHY